MTTLLKLAQPVTEYEWVAIFEKWQDEVGTTPTQNKKYENDPA